MKHKSNLKLFKIQGLIVPATWDEEGNPLSVALATFEEDEYLVHRDEKGDQLLGLLRKEVEVTGVVGVKDGIKTIKVAKYALIKKTESIERASKEECTDYTKEGVWPEQ